MTLSERVKLGVPLTLAELSSFIGYSVQQIRKWAQCGAIETVKAPLRVTISKKRVLWLIPVDEAARIGREMRIP
jgi:hypothetical protein